MESVRPGMMQFNTNIFILLLRLVINERKEYDQSGTKEYDRFLDPIKISQMACQESHGILYTMTFWF